MGAGQPSRRALQQRRHLYCRHTHEQETRAGFRQVQMQRRGLVADPLLRHTENMWNIQEALDWLAGLEFFGVKLGLEQTRELFRRIGSPERKLR